MTTVEDWNAALLDVLLPAGDEPGHPVLLSCDDLAVERAGTLLGIADDAVASLAECLRSTRQITFERGVRGIVGHARLWRRLPRPRPLPSFVSGLAIAVVAASRMDRDEQASGNAYYLRLCQILGIDKRDDWPGVAGFDGLMSFFHDLQDWLAVEEEGRRGALVLRPPPPNLSTVGVAIGQAPLRGRDRSLLGTFFRRDGEALKAGHDPVRLLRRWGYASMLSAPTREKLDDSELEDVMRAALRSALTAWDGAVLDDDGFRVLDADLYLRVLGPRVALRLVVTGLEEDADAQGPDGPLVVPGGGGELLVPLGWLEHAASAAVALRLTTRRARIRVLPSTTILFAPSGAGLRRVTAAADTPVAVLTSDASLLSEVREDVTSGAPLPSGWRLIFGVEPDRLPATLRRSDPADEGSPVQLVGGLMLRRDAYLLDHPPLLLCDMGEPARVEVNGIEQGEAHAGVPFDVRAATTRPGTYTIIVGDRCDRTIELAEHGPRAGADAYGWQPTGPVWTKASATGQPSAEGEPTVHGAVIADDGKHLWRPGLLTRHQDLIDVIYRDGTWTTCAPPPEDGWHRRLGIRVDEPWEIPRGPGVAYLLLRSRQRQVICHADLGVEPSEALLDVVAGYEDAAVADRTSSGTGRSAWSRLLDRALYEEKTDAPAA